MELKRTSKIILVFAVLLLSVMLLSACNNYDYAETDQLIIGADSLADYIDQDNVVFVDMQSAEDYAAGHLANAVNIELSELMINVPVENMLTSASKIDTLMTSKGINNDTLILGYDSDKMSASRLLWSLMVYGNSNVRVINGGIEAIRAAGYAMTDDPDYALGQCINEKSDLMTAEEAALQSGFSAADTKDEAWYIGIKEMQELVNSPNDNTVILDVRTDAEYLEGGKIPGALMMDYNNNYYADGTFTTTQNTQINYLQNGINPEKQIIIYCRTSVRAAAVFVCLYDAGYRNLRIYDGAWLEWSANSANPIEYADNSVPIVNDKDAS